MIKSFLVNINRRRRLAKAVRWRLFAEKGISIEGSGDLHAWLEARDNRLAYDHVGRVWEVLDSHKEAPELLSMRRAVLRRAYAGDSPRNLPWAKLAAATACCIAILSVSLVVWKALPAKPSATYATGIGERRVVALADGSRITMDSSSTVREVRFSGRVRAFALLNGRARFDVAHDLSRPFTVAVGAQTVIAIGTAFSVERLSDKTLVTLDEGLVVVRNKAPSGKRAERSIWLAPGQELVATPAGNLAVQKVNLETADAWRRGQIVLTDEPLVEAVEQVNRYIKLPLKVDPAVANLRVSGVFNVQNLDTLVASLTSYFPLKSRLQDGNVLLEKRD